MGNNESEVFVDQQPQTIDHLARTTLFNNQQLIKLREIYNQLADRSGKIDEQEFIEKLKFPNPEIGQLMYQMLDTDHSNTMSFDEFVIGLNSFLPAAPLDDKIKLCFEVYDRDHGGTVSGDEIMSIIEINLKNNTFVELTTAQLTKLVDDLVAQYDSSGTGELSFADFRQMVLKSPGILDSFDLNMDDLSGFAPQNE